MNQGEDEERARKAGCAAKTSVRSPYGEGIAKLVILGE